MGVAKELLGAGDVGGRGVGSPGVRPVLTGILLDTAELGKMRDELGGGGTDPLSSVLFW